MTRAASTVTDDECGCSESGTMGRVPPGPCSPHWRSCSPTGCSSRDHRRPTRWSRFTADPDLVPPVALLAYRQDNPAASAFWPFAVFSPEWQAMSWAARRDVPVAFMDLPAAILLADGKATPGTEPAEEDEPGAARRPERAGRPAARAYRSDRRAGPGRRVRRSGALVGGRHREPAGRASSDSPFEAVTEAMTAVRADRPETDGQTLRREAHMRKVLRAQLKSGPERVAVVCGAWHAPALAGTLPGKPPTTTATTRCCADYPPPR